MISLQTRLKREEIQGMETTFDHDIIFANILQDIRKPWKVYFQKLQYHKNKLIILNLKKHNENCTKQEGNILEALVKEKIRKN